MRAFALLARRDLVQRLPLFIASLAMGLFILGLPLLPGSRLAPAELRGAAGLVAALLWSAVLALILGGSIFTRDLTENRLAFDFRLPVRPGAIWAARLLAAVVTIALAAGLVLAPSAVAGMDLAGASAGLDELIGHGIHGALAYAPLAILALLLLANPVALAARSRSRWAGVDLISLGIVALTAFWTMDSLRLWEAEFAIFATGLALTAFLVGGTAFPAILQVQRGRTEADLAHRSFSLTLFATALLTSVGMLGFAAWTLHPGIRDLSGYNSSAVGLGPDWVQLSGLARRGTRTPFRFLLQPSAGRVLRLGPAQSAWQGAKRSLDGATIAWMESERSGEGIHRLITLQTPARELAAFPTQVVVTACCGEWALSPAGRTVATLEYLGRFSQTSRLTVSDIETGGIEATLVLPSCRRDELNFVSERELLFSCELESSRKSGPDLALLVRSIDLPTKIQRVQEGQSSSPYYEVAPGYVRGTAKWLRVERTSPIESSATWSLLDSETGKLIVPLDLPLATELGGYLPTGRQLSDLRYALTWESASLSRLFVVSKNGALEQTIALPAGKSPRILAEAAGASGVLIGRIAPGDGPWDPVQSLTVVDLQAGTTRELDGRFQIGSYGELGANETTLVDARARLVWFDPDLKQLKPLLQEAQYSEKERPFH